MRKYLGHIALILAFAGCEFDREPELPSVEERVGAATDELVDLLISPANGWRVDYQPNPGGAEYLIIMEYERDGSVRIQSDVITESREFRDDTISYRIDARQGLELIMETYGVFHFLSEVVGGGFQFVYVNQTDGNLVFRTKDGAGPILVFQPAGPNDADGISTEALPNLLEGSFQDASLAGAFAMYNIYMPSTNHTISAYFDIANRRIRVDGIATGRTIAEIIANGPGTQIDEQSNFTLSNEVLILDRPISASHNGSSYTISEIPVENLVDLTEAFCTGTTDSVVQFTSTGVPGLGNFEMTSSLFATHSTFVDDSDNPYSAAQNGIFDENDETINSDVLAVFPDAVVQQWYQGFDLGNGETLTAFGWVTVNEINQVNFYLREFTYVKEGNIMNITWGDLFISKRDGTEVTDEEREGLTALTDQVFEGGQVYTFDVLNIDDLFELYNACNDYKIFLFR